MEQQDQTNDMTMSYVFAGAFLLPYFLCVVIGGIPMFYLEVALGQFMSVGGIGAWKICPLLQGNGVASITIVSLLNIYYNVILAWAFYYLFHSFTSVLPWSHCNNEWNTEHCLDSIRNLPQRNLSDNGNLSVGDTAILIHGGNNLSSSLQSYNWTNPITQYVDPVTEFWEKKVLQISDGVDNIGPVKWDLALCLLLAWVVVYLCICKGIKSSGKVMYVTATTPYILMTVLFIRGLTLPGALNGIKFYLIPDWQRLLDTQVWVDAGTQIFFSYSISLGTLTALGSYNTFNHNSWRDSIIFACTNSGTSFFAGFVIFSVLGFMAHEQGVSVADVAESGPGLAFIAYPKAVAQMPLAPVWSILFFLMIILLGLDSQFVGVEGFVTAVVDEYPHYLRKGYRTQIFVGIVCLVSFLIGLSMVTQGGIYVFLLFDYYSGSRIILLVAFCECVTIAYLYGASRFYDNIEMMLGFRIGPYMKISWMVTTPIFALTMFVLCLVTYSDLTYNRHYTYPSWAIAIGWGLASCSVIMIPLVAVVRMIRTKGTLVQRVRKLLRPSLLPHQLRPEDSLKDLATHNTHYTYEANHTALRTKEDTII